MSEETAAPAEAAPEAPAPEATQEAPAPEAPQEAAPAPESNIEDLLSAEIPDPILSSNENYTGINYQDVVQSLPDDAKKIIANLRSSYTKKTQELAEQQKIMQQHVEEIGSQRKALFESDFYKNVQQTAGKETGDLDPFSPKSFEDRIQSEVAKRMQEMLKPMKQAQELQQQKYALETFKREHPDLENMKKEVAGVLMQNEHMNLEQAYWVVKGKKLQEQSKNQEAELGRYKQAAKSAGLKVGGASRGNMRGVPQYVLDKDDPIAIYRWLEANKTKGKI